MSQASTSALWTHYYWGWMKQNSFICFYFWLVLNSSMNGATYDKSVCKTYSCLRIIFHHIVEPNNSHDFWTWLSLDNRLKQEEYKQNISQTYSHTFSYDTLLYKCRGKLISARTQNSSITNIKIYLKNFRGEQGFF